jgi:hypothetical protein
VDLEQLRGWLDAYGRAWEQRSPDAAAEIFSEDATYHETPFSEGMRGRDAIRAYWATAADHQKDVAFRYEIVNVSPAVVLWQASYTKARSDEPTNLDGVFLLEFDAENRCSSLREWWHADTGPSF